MTGRPRLPLVQIGVAAAATFALVVGGTVTVQGWTRTAVRPLAVLLLVASLVHLAARFAPSPAAARGLAWALLAAGAALVPVLQRPAILAGIAAAGVLDVAVRDPGSSEGGARLGPALAALVLAVVLAPVLAALGLRAWVAARLLVTGAFGAALVAAYTLQSGLRARRPLLGGALAFAIVFRGVAAPVLPLGPIVAYWVLVGAVALAALVGTDVSAGPPLTTAVRRHRQVDDPRPDPLSGGLAAALDAYQRGFANPGDVAGAARDVDPALAEAAREAAEDHAAPDLAAAIETDLQEDPR